MARTFPWELDNKEERLSALPKMPPQPWEEEQGEISKYLPVGLKDIPRSVKNVIQEPSRESISDLLFNISRAGASTLKTILGEHPAEATGLTPLSLASVKPFLTVKFSKGSSGKVLPTMQFSDVGKMGISPSSAMEKISELYPFAKEGDIVKVPINLISPPPANIKLFHATRKPLSIQKEGIKRSIAGVIKKDPEGAKVFLTNSPEKSLMALDYEEDLRKRVNPMYKSSKGDKFVVEISVPETDIVVKPNGDIVMKRDVLPEEIVDIFNKSGKSLIK